MIGVSLVSADDWILRYFASDAAGAISHINYAKRLLAVPIAILGQAVGQASLPFFARLFGEKRMQEFADTVNGSVYRTAAAALLATSLMMAAALPLIDLVYRLPHGHFVFSDSQATATYFFWFSVSLVFWSAQGLYARAFYAAGNTLTPMVASSLITIASLPILPARSTMPSHRLGLRSPPIWGSQPTAWPWLFCCTFASWFGGTNCNGEGWGKPRALAAAAGFLSYRVARAIMVSGQPCCRYRSACSDRHHLGRGGCGGIGTARWERRAICADAKGQSSPRGGLNDHVEEIQCGRQTLFSVSLESLRKYLETNVISLFSVCRQFARSDHAKGIINFSSTYGLVSPLPDLYSGREKHIGYSTSKGAVIQLTKHLATHLAPRIRVNCIAPGGVEHDQGESFIAAYSRHTPMGRMMRSTELNKLLEYLCSDHSNYMTGSVITIDGGWTAW